MGKVAKRGGLKHKQKSEKDKTVPKNPKPITDSKVVKQKNKTPKFGIINVTKADDKATTSKYFTPDVSSKPTLKLNSLDYSFYDVSCKDLATAMLGQTVVKMVDGKRFAGKIVETEAYLGRQDKAAHSYKRRTPRNEAMFMAPGTAYVYNIYGTYCCLNISSQGTQQYQMVIHLTLGEKLA